MSSPLAISSPLASPRVSIIKTQKMSITQTYFLAHKARAKLSHEAAMPDHNLRLLVGHANLLDSLMLELADAEREQESWFNQSVRNASHHDNQPSPVDNKHVQWAATIAEEDEEDDYDSASDDDSSVSSDEDVEMTGVEVVSLRRVASHTFKAPASPTLEVMDMDLDNFEEDDYEEEDYAQLTLARTHSHQSIASPPPELELDLDESSEDESMPPSPPSTTIPSFEQQQYPHHQQQKNGSESPLNTTDLFDDSVHYMPTRTSTHPATLGTAIPVY